MKKILPLIFLSLFFQNIFSQHIEICVDSLKSSFRGLSVVNDDVLWVSGSNGTVGRSEDGGKTWKWMQIKGFEKADFRDIEAFNERTAVVMGVDEPAFILRTIDAGENWKVVYANHTKAMFLDGMDFLDQSGTVIGDPVKGRFFKMQTFDSGKNWKEVAYENKPVADSGEACFAASGTNVRELGKAQSLFVSGGLTSHIFIRNKKVLLPILQGKESTGANSVAVHNNTLIVVGGDYLKKDMTVGNCAISYDGGETWIHPETSPSGYRSCVQYLSKNKWITCGLNGVDISTDNGMNWKRVNNQSFNVCGKAKKGKAVYFAGAGKIGKLDE